MRVTGLYVWLPGHISFGLQRTKCLQDLRRAYEDPGNDNVIIRNVQALL